MNALPGPLAHASLAERTLARLGFVRFHRYTDRLAVCESLETRLESSSAAVDAQRARLADHIERIDELNDELTELRGELAASDEERASAPAELRPVLFNERHAAVLRDRGVSQRDLLDAVSALVSDNALALTSQAVAPAVPAEDRLHISGGAYHLHAFRMRLEHAVRPRNEN